MPIKLAKGDITKFEGDAIVNAANPALAHGGGVCGVIFQAAGGLLDREIEEKYPLGCHTGNAVITFGYHLPARYIIHAVGPKWRGGDMDEDVILARTYRSALTLAVERGIRSIAFPAISTGSYGFLGQLAVRIAVMMVWSVLVRHPNLAVTLYAYGDQTYQWYEEALAHLRKELTPMVNTRPELPPGAAEHLMHLLQTQGFVRIGCGAPATAFTNYAESRGVPVEMEETDDGMMVIRTVQAPDSTG